MEFQRFTIEPIKNGIKTQSLCAQRDPEKDGKNFEIRGTKIKKKRKILHKVIQSRGEIET